MGAFPLVSRAQTSGQAHRLLVLTNVAIKVCTGSTVTLIKPGRRNTYCGWTKSCTTLNHGKHVFLGNCAGIESFQVFLRWCRISSIHSTNIPDGGFRPHHVRPDLRARLRRSLVLPRGGQNHTDTSRFFPSKSKGLRSHQRLAME